MTDVWLVVLTWNNAVDTLACLASLDEHVRPHHDDLTVLVVDNASSDGTQEQVAARFPWARTLQTGSNLGYAGGNNRGVDRARAEGAEVVVVLNNDTLAVDDLLGPLLAHLAEHPGSACSPDVRYAAEPEVSWFAGGVVADGRWLRHARPSELPAGPEPYRTDWLSGCCVAATATVWERVGGFDAWFFLVFEDGDWSLRARERGVLLWVVPRAVLLHRVSSTMGAGGPLAAFYFARNGLVVAGRHLGRRATVFFLGRVARQAARDLRDGRTAVGRATVRGLAAGLAALPRRPRPRPGAAST